MAGAYMIPGRAKPRSVLPWLPYGKCNRVIINQHDFPSGGGFNPTATWGNFDGVNDYVDIPSFSGFTSTVSISFWIKYANPDAQTINYPVSFYGSSAFAASVRTGGSFSDANNAAKAITLAGIGGFSSAVANSFTTAGDGTSWRHIVATYDSGAGTKTKLYKDGTLLSMFSTGGSSTLNSISKLVLGSRSDGFWFCAAKLADVRIYNDILTASEITWLASVGASGSDPTTSNLQAWYKFAEGSGTTVGDSSGNGRTGTATNITPASFWSV